MMIFNPGIKPYLAIMPKRSQYLPSRRYSAEVEFNSVDYIISNPLVIGFDTDRAMYLVRISAKVYLLTDGTQFRSRYKITLSPAAKFLIISQIDHLTPLLFAEID